MTRKHFEALAAELNYNRPIGDLDNERVMGWQQAVMAVSHACRKANPRFDHDRFAKAAGATQ
jgi:hypothetical protein